MTARRHERQAEPGDRVVAFDPDGWHRLPVAELYVKGNRIAGRVFDLDAPRGGVVRAGFDDADRENTVPAPTLAGEEACGARLSRNSTSKDCKSRTAVATYSALACRWCRPSRRRFDLQAQATRR